MNRSTTPFFGRSYKLTVFPATDPDNQIVISGDEWEPDALRFSFEIEQVAYAKGGSFWYAEIDIYNCDGTIAYGPSAGKTLIADLLTENSKVRVQAGYQADGEPIAIWEGILYQALWERVNVTDFKLTLRCTMARGLPNFVKANIDPYKTLAEQVKKIAESSITPIGVTDSQLHVLGGPRLARSKTVYGNPNRYLSQVAASAQVPNWFTADNFSLASLQGGAQLYYAPPVLGGPAPTREADGITRSLIGSPQQTMQGIQFRVLLDSRLQIISPLPVVSVDRRYIRQQAIKPPVSGFMPRKLDNQDSYYLVGVRHVGDTRGNAWYSEATCWSLITDVKQLFLGTPSPDIGEGM
jgi:hypothetical protein